jgi:5-methylcytosine-specific restriction endonuclease McrA
MQLCKKGLHDLDDPMNVYVQPSTGARHCKLCRAEYQRIYSLARQKTSPEKEVARKHAWHKANTAKIAERQRLYREANPEKEAARKRAYRQANPDACRNRDRRRRATKAAVPSEPFTLQDIVDRDGIGCALCGTEIDMALSHAGPRHPQWRIRPTIDHVVPLSLGGPDSLANAQLAHHHCNARKGNRVEVVAC